MAGDDPGSVATMKRLRCPNPKCQSDALVSAGCIIREGDDYAGDEFRIVAECFECAKCRARVRVDVQTDAVEWMREVAEAAKTPQ